MLCEKARQGPPMPRPLRRAYACQLQLAILSAVIVRLLCAGMIDRWVHRLVQLL